MGQRLCETFGRYPWGFILQKGRSQHWKTEKRHPARPRLLWKHWNDGDTQIGVRFGSNTQYALLDIDQGSDYLTPQSLRDIHAALETMGIVRTVRIRSSWSGGLHIYIPLPDSVNTFNLAVALKGTLQAHGFTVTEGQLEIFPNTKAFGRYWLGEFVDYQAHRLPLQPGSGSVMLNESLEPVGDKLERFFWSWDFAEQAQDMSLLRQALAIGKRNRKRYKRLKTSLEQWREDLQDEVFEGWTGPGQTNHLLHQIGTYGRVFLSLELDDLAHYIHSTATGLPGYETWCRHTHEIWRKSLCWARSIVGYYFPCQSESTPRSKRKSEEANKNKQLSWEKQSAIWNAIVQIRSTEDFEGWNITRWVTALIERTGVSTRTLYKHKELWHPDVKDQRPDWDTTLSWLRYTTAPPTNRESSEPLLVNGFLQPGGEMKSLATETGIRKTNLPGWIGGDGGEGGLSTGPDGG